MDHDTNSDNTNNQNDSEKIEVKVEKHDDSPVATGPATFGQDHKSSRLSKRNLLIGASAAFVLLFGTLGYLNFIKSDTPEEQVSQNQRASLGMVVSLIDGTAQYSSDSANWDTLSTDTTLKQGDLVQTEAGSRVILTLDDGSIVRLNESSVVRLESLFADEVRIANVSGEVYSRVVASERSFTVTVDDAEYSALGTAYSTVNKTTDKGVQVLQSSVSLKDTDTKIDEGKQFYKDHQNTELKDKITDIPVDQLKSSAFMIWNLEQDKQSPEFKDKLGYLAKIEEQPAPAPAPAPVGASIKLTGSVVANGLKFNWTVTNIGSGHDGFKLVRSKTSTSPTYGKDDASFVSGAGARSYTWEDTYGKTYNYRICVYTDGSCNTYSNTVTLTSPYVAPVPPTGTVTLNAMNGNSATWTQTGTAPYGYRLYMSPTPGAEPSTKIYKGDGMQHTVDTTGLTPGAYKLYVCKSTHDGMCAINSNEVQLTIN